MAAKKKWYQDYRIATPIVLAIIGLLGTWITTRNNDARPKESPPATSPAANFTVIINVLDDKTENRLAGAKAVSDELGFLQESDSNGRCTVAIPSHLRKIRLTVSKSGYRTLNVELNVFDGMDPARIRLQKL